METIDSSEESENFEILKRKKKARKEKTEVDDDIEMAELKKKEKI